MHHFHKILESYENHIILVEEPAMHFTSDFWSCCKNFLEKDGRRNIPGTAGIDAGELSHLISQNTELGI